jgi:hypothetical protein
MNAEIRDRLDWIKAALLAHGISDDTDPGVLLSAPYHVKARRTTNQSLTTAVATSINFTAADEFDSDDMHDTSSQTARVTIQPGGAGFWMVGGGASFEANATGTRQIYVELNGVGGTGTEIPGSANRSPADSTAQTKVGVAVPTELAVGDFICLTAVQNSGGLLNVTDATLWAVRYAVS